MIPRSLVRALQKQGQSALNRQGGAFCRAPTKSSASGREQTGANGNRHIPSRTRTFAGARRPHGDLTADLLKIGEAAGLMTFMARAPMALANIKSLFVQLLLSGNDLKTLLIVVRADWGSPL